MIGIYPGILLRKYGSYHNKNTSQGTSGFLSGVYRHFVIIMYIFVRDLYPKLDVMITAALIALELWLWYHSVIFSKPILVEK